jgi:hypothetical protein
MNKIRKEPPKKIKDKVLKEFNHLCAICCDMKPYEIHHIDGNPSNNDPLNLIPLCPNCHTKYMHDPTNKIEMGKIKLFRIYKDKTILSDKFHPLFIRMQFLDSINLQKSCMAELLKQVQELLDFIKVLNKGEFYKNKLKGLLKPPSSLPQIEAILIGDYDSKVSKSNDNKKDKEREKAYRDQLLAAKEEVEKLIVECLCYQSWEKNNVK